MNKFHAILSLGLLSVSACTTNPNFNPDLYTNSVDGFTCPLSERMLNAAAGLCYDHNGLMVSKAEFDVKKKAYEEEKAKRDQCFNRFFTPLYAIPKWCPNYQSTS